MSEKNRLRYIPADSIEGSIMAFDSTYAVTRGEFSIDVNCPLADLEWNHMDQLHRQYIHNTYQKNLRIALGREFAVSLTRWGRWPFLITVTDVRVKNGLFYQDFVLAGVIFIHNIISMREEEKIVHLKLEWIIQSHRWLKPLHVWLGRKFTALNVRLQEEDAAIRNQRRRLRGEGYSFLSDPPDYYSANQLTQNTVYPPVTPGAFLATEQLKEAQMNRHNVGGVEFLFKRTGDDIYIWPAACPHEGGELAKGVLHDDCRLQCPWHGLKFPGARISPAMPVAQAYGFDFILNGERIFVETLKG